MAITTPTADFVTGSITDASITAIATGMNITTGLTLPATNGVLQIGYASTQAKGADNGPETIFYTSYDSGTGAVAGMTRGVAGTTGVAHSTAEGKTIQAGWSTYYLTNGDLGKISEASAWTDWVPTIYATDGTTDIGGGATITAAKYIQIGKLVFGYLKITGIGNPAGQYIQITVPTAPKTFGVEVGACELAGNALAASFGNGIYTISAGGGRLGIYKKDESTLPTSANEFAGSFIYEAA